MRILHEIVGILLALAAVALGGWMVGAALGGSHTAALFGLMLAEGGRTQALSAGAALLALAALDVLTGWPRRQRVLAYDNEGGSVAIRTTAVSAFIRQIAGEFPAVVNLVPAVSGGRRGVVIEAAVRLRAGAPVQETCELLQQRIRARVTTVLGLAQVRDVRVRVTEIVGEQAKA